MTMLSNALDQKVDKNKIIGMIENPYVPMARKEHMAAKFDFARVALDSFKAGMAARDVSPIRTRKQVGMDGNFTEVKEEARNTNADTLVPRGNAQRTEPNTGLSPVPAVRAANAEAERAAETAKQTRVTDSLVTQLATSMAKLTRAIAKDGGKGIRATDSAAFKKGAADGKRAMDAQTRTAMDAAHKSDSAYLAEREAFAKASGAALPNQQWYRDMSLGGIFRPHRIEA